MASIFSHAIVAVALGAAFTPPARLTGTIPTRTSPSIWRLEIPRWSLLGVVCAAIPDVDVISFSFGIGYGEPMGHRGFTHSILFAIILATLFTAFAFPRDRWDASRLKLWLYFFLCGVSHGLLDAMTNEGLGVAFFSPLDLTRYFLPWRPIQVSPIGVASFFSSEGLAVIRSEARWIILPAIVFAAAVGFLKRPPGLRRASR